MSTKKTLAVLAASSVLAMFALAPVVHAGDVVKEEQDQLNNSAQPDVDPGASKGPDAPISNEEQMQLGNQPGPDVKEPSMKGGESVPTEEQKDIED
jgi:hypothetical protein